MVRISAVYPNTEGSRFDGAYYVRQHSPFAEKLFDGTGLIELRTTLGVTALDGAPPPYWALCELIFNSRENFDAAIAAHGETLFADIVNYTDVAPVLQVSAMPGDVPANPSGD